MLLCCCFWVCCVSCVVCCFERSPLGSRRHRTSSGSEEEITMRARDCRGRKARMREEHSASGEEPKTEVQLRARVAQLEEIRGRHVRGSGEAAEHIRTKAAKRRVGGCAEDVLPSTEQDLACWLDDRQTEFRDALDMANMEPAPSQTSSPGGSPRWRVLFHHRPHSRTWCREESDKVGRGVPPKSSPSRKFVGSSACHGEVRSRAAGWRGRTQVRHDDGFSLTLN